MLVSANMCYMNLKFSLCMRFALKISQMCRKTPYYVAWYLKLYKWRVFKKFNKRLIKTVVVLQS